MPSFLLVAALSLTAQVLSLPARLTLVIAAERIPVPVVVKDQDFVVEQLTGTIELRRLPNAKAIAARMALGAGQICPTVDLDAAGTIVIRCKTKRFDAHLVVERGKIYVEIEQLRGLPWNLEGDRLDVFYNPELAGFGGPCPGDTPVGKGECALRSGRTEEARALFKEALESSSQASLAGLRLGDLALAAGDVGGAMTYYRHYGYGDPYGRLATARLCELDGNCLAHTTDRVFAAQEQPEPVKSELLLRGARVALFNDDYAGAGHLLAQVVADRTVGACTEFGRVLCRRILLIALQRLTGPDGVEALETYLNFPNREQGPMGLVLMRAAAERSATVGAPAFGANLLASHATTAEGPGLGDYLLRTAELYLLADDPVRARVVLDYADTRLGKGSFASPRWTAVRKQAQVGEGEEPIDALSAFELMAAESVRDLAAAYGSIARARTVQQ